MAALAAIFIRIKQANMNYRANKTLLTILVLTLICYCPHGQHINKATFITRVINFTWMPDNKNMLLTVLKGDEEYKLPPVMRVYLFNPGTKKLTFLLADAASPAISPDGRQIAYVKRLADGKSDIHIYNLKRKADIAVATDTAKEFSPSWSADGRQLAYNILQNGVINIFVMDVATHATRQITQNGRFASYNPVWSPKGSDIVYYLEKGDRHDQLCLLTVMAVLTPTLPTIPPRTIFIRRGLTMIKSFLPGGRAALG
jgi:hypothetical protein